jgi:hypothetical protein
MLTYSILYRADSGKIARPLPLRCFTVSHSKPQTEPAAGVEARSCGDFLIGLPGLERLRQVLAADNITLVCGSWSVNLAEGLQVADRVRAYGFFAENGALDPMFAE